MLNNINHNDNIQKILKNNIKSSLIHKINPNPNFGSSDWAFKMDLESFETYDYVGKEKLVLDLFKFGNIGEDFDVLYNVISKTEAEMGLSAGGCIIGNIKTGECFFEYAFSFMELDENTWFSKPNEKYCHKTNKFIPQT